MSYAGTTTVVTGLGIAAKQPMTIRRTEDAQRLGDVLESLMAERLCGSYEQAQRLRQAWLEALPAALAGHCRIESLSGGVLKVAADGPGYMHELRLCQKELCERIQSGAPRAGVRSVKIVIG